MAFVLSLTGLLIAMFALVFLLTRRRSPAPGSPPTAPAPGPSKSEPWTRAERIALASFVVGTILGVLGLLAR